METGKQSKRKAIVISTVIATNCTSRYKSYRMYQSFTFTEMTVIYYNKTKYLLALEFGTLTYLAF